MFSTLDKAKETLNLLNDKSFDELEKEQCLIKSSEFQSICEDLLNYKECCDSNNEYIQRLLNYIRLLEKENEELRSGENDKKL